MQDGCILWGNRVVSPKGGRSDILRELHEAHPGETWMKRLARMFVWWPGLDHDIEQKVNGCHECQNCQPNLPLAPLILCKWPSRPWSRLHTNFAGSFKGQMFLVVFDARPKLVEVHPMLAIMAQATILRLKVYT